MASVSSAFFLFSCGVWVYSHGRKNDYISRGQVDSSVIKTDNVSIQVKTLKLTKENYIHWHATIKMGIVDRIDYINKRQKQLSEEDLAWRRWYLEETSENLDYQFYFKW